MVSCNGVGSTVENEKSTEDVDRQNNPWGGYDATAVCDS